MPEFYCENCGKEVPADVPVCPYCGKRFYSVRCPVCSYSGPASDFSLGCPACGYQGPGYSGKAPGAGGGRPSSGNKKKNRKGSLPDWVYRMFLAVLLAALALLIRAYLSL